MASAVTSLSLRMSIFNPFPHSADGLHALSDATRQASQATWASISWAPKSLCVAAKSDIPCVSSNNMSTQICQLGLIWQLSHASNHDKTLSCLWPIQAGQIWPKPQPLVVCWWCACELASLCPCALKAFRPGWASEAPCSYPTMHGQRGRCNHWHWDVFVLVSNVSKST